MVNGKKTKAMIGRTDLVTTKYDTYDVPEDATEVTFQVRAGSTTHKVNGKDVYWWGSSGEGFGSYTVKKVYDFTDFPPDTPSNLSISITAYTLTASVSGIDEKNTSFIEFYIYSTDSDAKKYSKKVDVVDGQASYTCTVAGGHSYYFKCRGLRSKAEGNWSEPSNIVETAPLTPEITKCVATTENSIQLEWSKVNNAKTYKIQYATNEMYFEGSDQVQTIDSVEGTSYLKTGLETGKNYHFRIQAKNDAGESGWSEVSSTLLGSGPAAPSTWSSTVTAMVGEKLTLYWVHNTEDGSEQTGAKIELEVDGVAGAPIIIEDDTNFFELETADYVEGTTIRWRVRTAALSGDFGDWSAQRIIQIYKPPSQALSLKDYTGADLKTLTSFPFKVSTKVDAGTQKPIGYHISIIVGQNGESFETTNNMGETVIMKDGDVVYSKYINGDKLNLSISANDVTFENGYNYTVKCLATMDSGLTAEASSEFSVDWSNEITEFVPEASISVDEDSLTASIQPYMTDLEGNPISGVRLSVYRRNYDGTFTEIISNVDNAKRTWVTDPHPALDYARYRVVAKYEATGMVVFTDLAPSPINCGSIVIQWNEQTVTYDGIIEDELASSPWSGSMLILPYNVDVSDSHKPDVEKVSYIGREHPVAYYGTQVGESSKWSAVIDKRDVSTLDKLRRLAKWMGDVYVREPSGTGYWANVVVSWNLKHSDLIVPVSIDVTRVEGGM
jgi:hypothetical protein